MKLTRRRWLQGSAATAVLAASPLPHARPVRAASAVRVGVILPTSGVMAFPGQSCRRGIDLAASFVAERGGPSLEILHMDAESKAENGRVAAEKLIAQGCSVLIGAFDSGITISAAQAAEAAKVPLVVNIAAAPQLTEQGLQYVFRNFPTAPQLIRNAVARIKELSGLTGVQPRTAVLLHVNDTFGRAMAGGVKALWKKLEVPIEIVEEISYDRAAKDLSVEVARAKASGADLVMPITRIADAILIVREMVKQDYNPMGIIGPGSPGPYEKAFTDATGKYGDEYMVSVPWYDPSRELTSEVLKSFRERYPDQRFELNVGFSFEAVQIVADAVGRAGSGEPGAIHAALRQTDIDDHIMYGGPIRFDAKGQNNHIGGVLLQIQHRQPVVVGPAEIAEAKPIFPMTPFSQR